jgi:hypothetical protein
MLQRGATHPTGRLRLVIETDDAALGISDFTCFADTFDVMACSGPREGDRCPAVDGQPCPLIESSDVVLNRFTDLDTLRSVAEGVRATSPEVPMVVALPAGIELPLPDGCIPLQASTSTSGQLQALRQAATQAPRPSMAADSP